METTINTNENTPITAPVNDFDSWLNSQASDVQNMIQTALKTASHKANSEAKSLRTRAQTTESVLEKIKARFEVDEISDELLDQLQKLPVEKLGAEERAKQVERKLKEIEAERNKFRDELTSTQKRIAEKSRDESILSALGKLGIRSDAMDSARKLVALDSSLDESGEWLYNNKPIQEYLQEWAKSNSYLLANPIQPGAGGRASVKQSPANLDLEYYKNASPEYRKAHADEFFQAMKKGLI